MGKIWTDQNKYQKWLDIEVLACEAWAQLGEIPKEAVAVIKEKANFDVDRINEIEATTHHDVIAFLTSVSEFVGPESRFIHLWNDIFRYFGYGVVIANGGSNRYSFG